MNRRTSSFGLFVICSLLTPRGAAPADLNLQLVRTDNETQFPLTAMIDVRAELSATLPNEGLALIGFDLSGTIDGQPFDVTDATVTPGSGPNMASFIPPNGIANPIGFGGTPLGGLLVQIGSAQPTIGGVGTTVVTNVAVSGSPEIIAHISIELAEPACGDYVLCIENAFANVIVDGKMQPAPFQTQSVASISLSSVTIPRFACVGDLNGSGSVNSSDLALLLGAWGPNPGDPADLNCSGTINSSDLALLLGNWGPCD